MHVDYMINELTASDEQQNNALDKNMEEAGGNGYERISREEMEILFQGYRGADMNHINKAIQCTNI